MVSALMQCIMLAGINHLSFNNFSTIAVSLKCMWSTLKIASHECLQISGSGEWSKAFKRNAPMSTEIKLKLDQTFLLFSVRDSDICSTCFTYSVGLSVCLLYLKLKNMWKLGEISCLKEIKLIVVNCSKTWKLSEVWEISFSSASGLLDSVSSIQ